jgi:hypothetical protein
MIHFGMESDKSVVAGPAVEWDGRGAAYSGRRLPTEGDAPVAASALHAENDVHDALHVVEALRVQRVGYFYVVVVCPGDFEYEAGGRKLKEPQREVAGVGIGSCVSI